MTTPAGAGGHSFPGEWRGSFQFSGDPARNSIRHIRISADLPYTIYADARAPTLDYKLTAEDGSGFSHAAVT